MRDSSDNPCPNDSCDLAVQRMRRHAIAIYIHFDMITIKPLYWLGDSLDQVRGFTQHAHIAIAGWCTR